MNALQKIPFCFLYDNSRGAWKRQYLSRVLFLPGYRKGQEDTALRLQMAGKDDACAIPSFLKTHPCHHKALVVPCLYGLTLSVYLPSYCLSKSLIFVHRTGDKYFSISISTAHRRMVSRDSLNSLSKVNVFQL